MAAGFETGTDAARAFGWAVSTYLGYENGDREPGKKAARRLADAFHVDLDWLLTGRGTMKGAGEDWFREFFSDRPEDEIEKMRAMLEHVFPKRPSQFRKKG